MSVETREIYITVKENSLLYKTVLAAAVKSESCTLSKDRETMCRMLDNNKENMFVVLVQFMESGKEAVVMNYITCLEILT